MTAKLLEVEAETALLLDYQDQFRSHLVAAAQGARALGSQKRVRGACETFEMARKVRLYEWRVKEYVRDATESEAFLAGDATGLEEPSRPATEGSSCFSVAGTTEYDV